MSRPVRALCMGQWSIRRCVMGHACYEREVTPAVMDEAIGLESLETIREQRGRSREDGEYDTGRA